MCPDERHEWVANKEAEGNSTCRRCNWTKAEVEFMFGKAPTPNIKETGDKK